MRITRDEAEAFFAHPSQRKAAMLADGQGLPDWCHYYAVGGICGAFHPAFWPGVWMVHIGVKPEAWGHVDAAAVQGLREAADDLAAVRFVAWVNARNRAVCRFMERVGFEQDGRLPLDEPLLCYGWRP